jgi:hypothetical protein
MLTVGSHRTPPLLTLSQGAAHARGALDTAVPAVGLIRGQVGAANAWAADEGRAGVEVAEAADTTDSAIRGRAATDAVTAVQPHGAREAAAAAVIRVVGEVGALEKPRLGQAAVGTTESDIAVGGRAVLEGRDGIRTEGAPALALDADRAEGAARGAVVAGRAREAFRNLVVAKAADSRGATDTAEPAVVGILTDVNAGSPAAIAGVAEFERADTALGKVARPRVGGGTRRRRPKGALAAVLSRAACRGQAAFYWYDPISFIFRALQRARRPAGAAPGAMQAS